MNTTAAAPLLTARRVSALARRVVPAARYSTKTGNGAFLLTITESARNLDDLQVLNIVRDTLRGEGYEATVVRVGRLYSASTYMVRVTDPRVQEAAQMQEREDARQAAREEKRCPDCTAPVSAHLPWCKGVTLEREAQEAAEKLTVREAHAVITGTADEATAAKVTVREAAALERAERSGLMEAAGLPLSRPAVNVDLWR